MSYLDLKELADELDDLRGRENDEDWPLDEDDEDRLKALSKLEDELGDLHVASRYKSPMCSDSDWREYCEEMADDCGMCERNSTLANYVDWDRWADDCQSDYSSVEFDGETYWYHD